MRARLAEGSYLAVQIPETLRTVWDWDAWAFNRTNGQVVNKAEPTRLIPYNYLAFSVSRQDEQPPGPQRQARGPAVKLGNAGPTPPGLLRAPHRSQRQKS